MNLWLLFTSIFDVFDEVPVKKPYSEDPSGNKQIKSFNELLQVLNHVLTTGPGWTDRAHQSGVVGLPFQACLDWPMGTPSGFALFLDAQVNEVLRKVLDTWGKFLQSPESAKVLGTDANGWLSEYAKSELTRVGNNDTTNHSFEELYHCDPSAKYHGYKSWDDFFTRTYREGIRPIADPDDDAVIANACESRTYNVAMDVKERAKFWIKGQPYSVTDMLARDDLSPQFVGGTIYQAFLSALSYHRWHAPVSGKVVKAYVKQGTYFSEPLFEGLGNPETHEIDGMSESTCQGYLTSIATRAIIFIEADNPAIGLICGVFVGMTEVSTCDITVKEGQHLKKGDQLGMFHFGGSTHCLLFRKGVNVQGLPQPGQKHNIPVRSKLAVVKA